MFTTPSQILDIQRVQVGAMNAVGQALMTGAEKLSRLNVGASRSAIDVATEAAQSMAGVRSPDDLAAVSQASARPSVEKLVNYTREWMGIVNGVNVEISRVVEQQVSESNRRMNDLLENAFKNAPAGSQQALAWLRNAIAASNSAFDTVTRVSRQASDWTQNNMAQAGRAMTATHPNARLSSEGT